jgi:hypothetical protein
MLAVGASLLLAFAAPAPDLHPDPGFARLTSLTASVSPPTPRSPSLFLHVLRTASLLSPSSPPDHPLLSQASHLVVKVEISDDGVRLNGVDVPLLPSCKGNVGRETAEVLMQLPGVQTLRVPDGSAVMTEALDEQGRLNPEALETLAEEYLGEGGLLGVKVSLRREKVEVDVVGLSEEAGIGEGWRVDVGVQILTLHGHNLVPTPLPPLHLLHIVVQPSHGSDARPFTTTTLVEPAYMAQTHRLLPGPLIPGAGLADAFREAAAEAGERNEGVRGWMRRVGERIRGKGAKGMKKGGGKKHKQQGEPTDDEATRIPQFLDDSEKVSGVGAPPRWRGPFDSDVDDDESDRLVSFHDDELPPPPPEHGWQRPGPHHRHPLPPHLGPHPWRHDHLHPPHFRGHRFHVPCWALRLAHVAALAAHIAFFPLLGLAAANAWRSRRAKKRGIGEERHEEPEMGDYVAVPVEKLEVLLPQYEETECGEGKG